VLKSTFQGKFPTLESEVNESEWGIDPHVDTWAVRHPVWDQKKADDAYAATIGLKVIPV